MSPGYEQKDDATTAVALTERVTFALREHGSTHAIRSRASRQPPGHRPELSALLAELFRQTRP
jgi:hypothetical protein